MTKYIDVLGDGASGFVGDGDNVGDTITNVGTVWMHVRGSTVVRVNGQRVDMTEVEVGQRREVDGWIIVRTATGVKARERRH